MNRLNKLALKQSWTRRIRGFLIDLLIFPRTVSKKYSRYNIGLAEMSSVFSNHTAAAIRSRNIKYVNLLIRLPLVLGILFFGIVLYFEFDQLKYDLKRSSSPIELRIRKNFLKPSRWVSISPEKVRLRPKAAIPFVLGIIISYSGAFFLSFNPAFRKQKEIQRLFSINRWVDEDGLPWDVIWTPGAILIYGFNTHYETVKQRTSFWNTINFSPDNPSVHPQDANVAYFRAAYKLPKFIGLEILPILKAKKQASETEPENKIPDIQK